jgi:hypothetical protein
MTMKWSRPVPTAGAHVETRSSTTSATLSLPSPTLPKFRVAAGRWPPTEKWTPSNSRPAGASPPRRDLPDRATRSSDPSLPNPRTGH